jgi:hypothetical protein
MHIADTTETRPRSILIWHNRNQEPTFIPIFSQHYEPLQYPLLFPHGTPGWGLKEDDRGQLQKTTPLMQRQWYCCRLLTEDRFLTFGRLASEYLCDMYSRVEEERLNFIRHGLTKDCDGTDMLCDIELPSTFVGSRKWVSEHTADSLALARTYGPPSLFITMTCNPDWPEIRCCLRPGQQTSDIPIIVDRAFKVRLQRLVHLLNTLFGRCVYMIKIIEFQKRGLPHVHVVNKVCYHWSYAFWDQVCDCNLQSLSLSYQSLLSTCWLKRNCLETIHDSAQK